VSEGGNRTKIVLNKTALNRAPILTQRDCHEPKISS